MTVWMRDTAVLEEDALMQHMYMYWRVWIGQGVKISFHFVAVFRRVLWNHRSTREQVAQKLQHWLKEVDSHHWCAGMSLMPVLSTYTNRISARLAYFVAVQIADISKLIVKETTTDISTQNIAKGINHSSSHPLFKLLAWEAWEVGPGGQYPPCVGMND